VARCASAMGHEDPFPPPELSASYVIRQETFAGTHGDGRDVPKAVVDEFKVSRRRSLALRRGSRLRSG